MNQGMQAASKTGKYKEMNLFLEPPEEMQPWQNLSETHFRLLAYRTVK